MKKDGACRPAFLFQIGISTLMHRVLKLIKMSSIVRKKITEAFYNKIVNIRRQKEMVPMETVI